MLMKWLQPGIGQWAGWPGLPAARCAWLLVGACCGDVTIIRPVAISHSSAARGAERRPHTEHCDTPPRGATAVAGSEQDDDVVAL